jgi:glycosyltransferase involved in cell wall biosynthesis
MSNHLPPINPLITVAVITYNQKDLLKETLDSILAQETEFTFEVLICDDASTDGTEFMCRELEARSKGWVKYLRLEKNSGITANANQGIQYGKGKYFALIGGDDLFLPNKLQIQASYMEDNPQVSISYHPVDIFDSSTNATLFLTNQTSVDTPLTLSHLIRMCIPGAVSVMVRRDAIPEGGFDVRLPTVSDWLFYIEVAAKGQLGFIPELLARYRKHGNQASFRTYELLEESLLNLDLAKIKLGSNQVGIDEAIRDGKARYLAGEAFRQLTSGNRENARSLFQMANKEVLSLIYLGGLISTYCPIPPTVFKKVKYLLKRYY